MVADVMDHFGDVTDVMIHFWSVTDVITDVIDGPNVAGECFSGDVA